ncbi:hypothetical protein [Rubellicoccus peritrichatus]|uniref:Uncharacterized protein n=1 Tax=Rubellicoccus peritrichatus TaxID=3080537 RepID=A0AAQ3QW64_9BACT|nr:hypothetical protein [Puniceicoccus sp. CR14]WOO42333.1 hypothetical protein RZN69_04470 [Puniceicoccus sp. CR14]
MFKIKLALIIGGGFLAFMGYEELKLSWLADEEASVVALADLEAGVDIDNAHIKIEEPVSVYGGLIYEYQQGKYDTGEPDESTSVSVTYYPVISQSHPFMVQLGELLDKYPDGIPDEVAVPDLNDFRVLVKTKRFKKIGDFPYDSLSSDEYVQGLVVNEVESLDNEEIGLLRQSFPNANFAQVLILEEGRAPAGGMKYLGMIGGGIALILIGLVWLLGGRKSA